jgi:hypothetical protein
MTSPAVAKRGHDDARDRLSIRFTLIAAVAKMLRDGLEPRLLQKHSGGGTRTHNQSVNSRLLCH